MGRSLSIIKRYSAILTALSARKILQALVLSHLDSCSVVWSGATRRDLGKLPLAQNRAARLVLRTGQHGWSSEQGSTAGPQNRAARLVLRTGQHGWSSEQGSTAGSQNRTARLALRTGQHGWPGRYTQRTDINNMCVILS
jgi:hypothetical protein